METPKVHLASFDDVFPLTTSSDPPADDRKLQELIIYIARASEGDNTFGAVKLNKILFLADFTAYVELGHPITGQRYQALKQGPAPRYLRPLQRRLEAEGAISILDLPMGAYMQKRTVALRDPDPDIFDPEELAVIDAVISTWWKLSAAKISEESHRFIGWELAAEGEDIPYQTALFVDREPTSEDFDVARNLEGEAAALLADTSD